MGIFQLNIDRFELKGRRNGNVLFLNVEGVVMVYFKSNDPKVVINDQKFIGFANTEKRVPTYGIFNFSEGDNRKLAAMARETDTPINTLPMVIMYINGIPKGKCADMTKLKDFLVRVLAEISKQNPNFARTPIQQQYTRSEQSYYKPESDVPVQPQKRPVNKQNSEYSDFEAEFATPENLIPYNKPWAGESF
jgi:hypothetical protein